MSDDRGNLVGKNCCRFDGQVCETVGTCYEAECQPPMKCYPGDSSGSCSKCEADNALTPSPGGAFHWSPQDRKDCVAAFTKIFTSESSLGADTIRKHAICVTNKLASDAVYTWNEVNDSLTAGKTQPGLSGYWGVITEACDLPPELHLTSLSGMLGNSTPKTCSKDSDCASGYVCSNGKCSPENKQHTTVYLLVGGGVVLILLFVLYMVLSRRSMGY